MERIPAACAMEWSIELDKGLRSLKPGKFVEAILEIGRRLEWWNREPGLTMAEYGLFGLIPGEDKLFANAILLRVADAFRLGDKHTKFCIAKVFYSELSHRKKNRKNRRNDGILSKLKVDNNHLELLRRVKMSFDDGDVEVRALALVLFGCWASFAKDSAEIRYCILSSVVSCHLLEVKASLFAAGCFCELSDDFACVLFEILFNMVSSSETSMAVRLTGVRAFAKLASSSSLANRAYKTGIKLPLDSSEKDLSIAVLISLSKIASKSTHLISGQVDFLFSFLNQDENSHLHATVLKCLRFILARGACHFLVRTDAIEKLFIMFNESKFPTGLEFEALQILHKVLLYSLPNFPGEGMLELFSKLLKIVENLIKSPILSKRQLASRFLVEIFAKFMGKVDISLDGVSSSVAPQVISFVTDRISFVVKSMVDLYQPDMEIELELKSLLGLLHLLVEECQNLGCPVLDGIYLFIESLVNKHDAVIVTEQMDLDCHEFIESGLECKPFIKSKVVLYISKVVISCLENLDKAEALTIAVHNKLKLLTEHVHKCSLFDSYARVVNSILWHSYIIYYCNKNYNLDGNSCISYEDYSIKSEIHALECAKKLLAGNDKWSVYKAGNYAACNGVWFAAASIFQQLIPTVQSDSCHRWLKSLAEFAHCEMRIRSLLLPNQGAVVFSWLTSNSVVPFEDDLSGMGEGTARSINFTIYIENLVGACNILRSSEETVGAIFTPGHSFGFQRWFLALRVKVLETAVDIIKLLGSDKFSQDNVTGDVQVESPRCLQELSSLVYPLTKISSRLKRLAEEFDLIAISFIGIDCKSLMIISTIALSCSLLAFCTGFALSFPHLNSLENSIIHNFGNSQDSLHDMLIQDLVSRLWYIDGETSAKLGLLLKACGQTNSCFIHQPRNQILDIGYEARRIITICKYAVNGVVGLQNEANVLNDDEILSRVANDGLKLLLNIVTKWIHLPFRTPNHFFRVRPCIYSELFVSNGDTRSGDQISMLQGVHLSLNICLQLKNVPPNLPARPTKLYCILYTSTSFRLARENQGQTQLGCQDWGSDGMLDSNEKLLRYVRGCGNVKSSSSSAAGGGGDVDGFACFEANERGQGFFSCLLDVSGFPVGNYRIKWQSSCVDTEGSYWSLLPLNAGPVFTVHKP